MQGRINERILTDLADVSNYALEVVNELRERQHDGSAVVLALSGDLGAGKTTFVQALAQTLGVTDTVTSPTFVIMKQYLTDDDHFTDLVHIDAYRIEEFDEMRVLGFSELMKKNGTIICIEWAEKITPLLPSDTTFMAFEIIEGEQRKITTTYGTENKN